MKCKTRRRMEILPPNRGYKVLRQMDTPAGENLPFGKLFKVNAAH